MTTNTKENAKAAIECCLADLEKTQKDFWNIDRNTANFLNMLIQIKGAKNVLELGTSNGYSGIWLASALKKTGGKLTTIEFWDNRQALAIENFKTCEVIDIIETRLGSALVVLDELANEIKSGAKGTKKPFDFVFIDANKGEYLNYFEKIDPILKTGGVIAADNILSHAKKVKPYVERVSADTNYQSEILNIGTGLMLSYKCRTNKDFS